MIPWTQQRRPRSAVPRPRTGETPIRHVRVSDDLWGEIERIATEEGRTKTDVVVEALTRYLALNRRQRRQAKRRSDSTGDA
jgi:hypothetical protein